MQRYDPRKAIFCPQVSKNYTSRITRSENSLILILRFNGQRYIPGDVRRRDRPATPLSVSRNSTHGRSRGAETMVPPLIPHCFDHVWNLKRLSIIILVSRRNEERKKERKRKEKKKRINKKKSSSSPDRVRVIIERGTRHLPVKSTHVAAGGWKILEPTIFHQITSLSLSLLSSSPTILLRVYPLRA